MYMEKSKLLWLCAVLLMTIPISSCGSDDEIDNPSALHGHWQLERADYWFGGIKNYNVWQTTMFINTIEHVVTIRHDNGGEESTFFPSGTYPYTTNTEYHRILTDKWVDVQYQVFIIKFSDDYGDHECKYSYSFQDGMLYLDGGVAFDSPRYYFRRIISMNLW